MTAKDPSPRRFHMSRAKHFFGQFTAVEWVIAFVVVGLVTLIIVGHLHAARKCEESGGEYAVVNRYPVVVYRNYGGNTSYPVTEWHEEWGCRYDR